MKHSDLKAGEHYAVNLNPGSQFVGHVFRVKLVSTEKTAKRFVPPGWGRNTGNGHHSPAYPVVECHRGSGRAMKKPTSNLYNSDGVLANHIIMPWSEWIEQQEAGERAQAESERRKKAAARRGKKIALDLARKLRIPTSKIHVDTHTWGTKGECIFTIRLSEAEAVKAVAKAVRRRG